MTKKNCELGGGGREVPAGDAGRDEGRGLLTRAGRHQKEQWGMHCEFKNLTMAFAAAGLPWAGNKFKCSVVSLFLVFWIRYKLENLL